MKAWRSTSTALWPCARMSVVSLCGKRMVSGNCVAYRGVMVGPCRRDPTAHVEQESKGGASETVGSSEMHGLAAFMHFWLPCPHHVMPPQHSRRIEQTSGFQPLLSQISWSSHRESQPVSSKTATTSCERLVEKQHTQSTAPCCVHCLCFLEYCCSRSIPLLPLDRVHSTFTCADCGALLQGKWSLDPLREAQEAWATYRASIFFECSAEALHWHQTGHDR